MPRQKRSEEDSWGHSRYYDGPWIVCKVRDLPNGGFEWIPRGGFYSLEKANNRIYELRTQNPGNNYEVFPRNMIYTGEEIKEGNK